MDISAMKSENAEKLDLNLVFSVVKNKRYFCRLLTNQTFKSHSTLHLGFIDFDVFFPFHLHSILEFYTLIYLLHCVKGDIQGPKLTKPIDDAIILKQQNMDRAFMLVQK